MSIRTYLPEIECLVRPGNDNRVLVTLTDTEAGEHQLAVVHDFVNHHEGKCWLPVQVLVFDFDRQRALIDLPGTSESGITRLWIPLNYFRPSPEKSLEPAAAS
jgi:hypothetical protein